MKTLQKAVEFNNSYLEAWRAYYSRFNQEELRQKLHELCDGMDLESRQLCEFQFALVPAFFKSPLSKYMYIRESAKSAILPEKTYNRLKTLDVVGENTGHKLDQLQIRFDLPERPLPELLTHTGLKYIPKIARQVIEGSTAIDAGAYIGDTARVILENYNPSEVIAIEPGKEQFEIMLDTLSVCHRAQIVPLNMGVGARKEKISLWGVGMGASAIMKDGIEAPASQDIESDTIDNIVVAQGSERVGMIKYDVEGMEYDAVQGSVETIKEHRPILLVSIYHTAKDFFEIKPFLQSLDLNYEFIARKISDDYIKELLLICVPR